MEEIEKLKKTIQDLEDKVKQLEKELDSFKPISKTLYEKG